MPKAMPAKTAVEKPVACYECGEPCGANLEKLSESGRCAKCGFPVEQTYYKLRMDAFIKYTEQCAEIAAENEREKKAAADKAAANRKRGIFF